MDPRPIGVFDSGIGGLSAVRALRRLLPEEPILYLGDTARMPYGCRPADEIDTFTGQITAWLLRRGVKVLIAACGTISCNAPSLQRLPVPCFDVVSAAAEAAARRSVSGRIGLAATEATVRSGRFARTITRQTGQPVVNAACPLLAPMIEQGVTAEDPRLTAAVAEYCRPFLENHVDTVVLGCTHYPLIAGAFAAVLGPSVTLIDCAAETAAAAAAALGQARLLSAEGSPAGAFWFTAAPPPAALQTATRLLGQDIGSRLSLLPLAELTGGDPHES